MIRNTYLTDAFGDYWYDANKYEYLESLDGAICEIRDLGFETYAKRTYEKLKEMEKDCKKNISDELSREGICPFCGADVEYDDKYGEYVCPECGNRYEDYGC